MPYQTQEYPHGGRSGTRTRSTQTCCPDDLPLDHFPPRSRKHMCNADLYPTPQLTIFGFFYLSRLENLRDLPFRTESYIGIVHPLNSTTRLNDGIFTVHQFSVATSARLHQSECVFRFYISGGIFDNPPGFFLSARGTVYFCFFVFCFLFFVFCFLFLFL
jgi:hypothetical protein